MIEIRKFRSAEAQDLAAFIAAHWQAGHVLSRQRPLLDWQHLDGGEYNYLGAWQDGEPVAILGYIPTRRFDPALAAADNVLWLALWKMRDDKRLPGLGLRLLGELGRVEPNVGVAVVGINPGHLPMYRAMRYTAGDVRQYVMFRRGAQPVLAVWPADVSLPLARTGHATLRELGEAELADLDLAAFGERAAQLPRKSGRYFLTRYLQHPFYRYRVHALELQGQVRGVLASRVAEHQQSRALRLVDWYGDATALPLAGTALGTLLEESGAEYADLWQFGIDPELLRAAGFAPVDPQGPQIVPTLFEPFVRQNRQLQFAFKAHDGRGCVVMRADGDQDRPNLLERAA